jgi:acetyl-CoA acetyltransferase
MSFWRPSCASSAGPGMEPAAVTDVIIGNAVGGGGNVARLALLEAGLPVSVPGLTVDRQCGSGLDAIVLAAGLVAAGGNPLFLAGGVESTSTAPLRAHRNDDGVPEFYRRAQFVPAGFGDPDMGVAAETVAQKFGVGRTGRTRLPCAATSGPLPQPRQDISTTNWFRWLSVTELLPWMTARAAG